MTESAERDGFDCAPLRVALAPLGVLFGARRHPPRRRDGLRRCGRSHAGRSRDGGRAGPRRIVARELLRQLGAAAAAPLPRSPSGAPEWPAGVIGSLAHDADFAVAAAARRGRIIGLGVDVEPAEPLPADVIDMVLSAAELREAAGDGVRRRLVFVAKEAVYKATHPLDGMWLDFEDIEVRLAEGRATLQDGRRLQLVTFAGPRLVAVALAFGAGEEPKG